ncbi:MAG: Flp family type IVb pilin [Nocardioides sp.]
MLHSFVIVVTALRGLRDRYGRETGATAVEYTLLVAGVALAMIAAAFAFGDSLEIVFQQTCNEVANNAQGSTC